MSDEAALLNAIIAHPDEDTPRLAYADWLDENDRPRGAEFVRVQCRLADMSPAEPEWAALIDREADLIFNGTGPIGAPAMPHPFHLSNCYVSPYRDELAQFLYRGFPFFGVVSGQHLLERSATQFTDDLAKLVATTTVRGVEFLKIPVERLSQLIDCPTFAELRGLTFHLSDPYADRNRTAALWKKLFASPVASRIEQFQARETLGPEVLAAFASSETFCGLRRYELPYLEAAPDAVRAWLGAPWARNLRYVHAFASEEPDKSAAIAEGLARLPELHTLNVGMQIAEAVTRVPAGFPRLALLRISHITVNHFRELLQTDWFGRLRALDLFGAGDQTVAALAKHPVAKELHFLQLHNSSLGKNGLRTIAKPGAFPNLIALHLERCVSTITGKKSATPEEVQTFLSKLSLPRLQVLNVSEWPLGDDGARALASNTALPGLKYLYLDRCQIREAGRKALADSPLGRVQIACKPII
jgi:uncharacterized protein (TIGR02996 family)